MLLVRRHRDSFASFLPRLSSVTALAISAVATGCAIAGDTELDCSVSVQDRFIEHRCATVRYASEFGDCLDSGDIDRYACVVMDADLAFCDASTTTSITAIFDRSDVSLDCAGGSIDHGVDTNGGGRAAPPRSPTIDNPVNYAPAVWFLQDRSIADVTIENCTMRRTGDRAIAMLRFFGGELDSRGLDVAGRQPVGHHDVLLRNLYIENMKSGIYLGNYSRDVVMDNLVVDGIERIAIYVESGSHRITLKNSVLANNRTREALAFDSAYDSTIENNLFVDNREGGVNLYQNCGELKGQVCPVVRDTPPNGNQIVGNRFVDNGISGLQIASRQGRSHSLGWCASLNGLPGRFEDTSQDNTVRDNVFVCDEGTSLIVMDGPNTITGNTIMARNRCVPFEVSTGGLGREASRVLDGLDFSDNEIDALRPPRLRNLPEGLRVDGVQGRTNQ